MPEGEDAQPAPKDDVTVKEVAKAQNVSVRKTKQKLKAKVVEFAIREIKTLFAPAPAVLLIKYRDMEAAVKAEGDFK
eukprot:6998201-Alexandrium_andersonii.AAC.1